ncbi:MAG TPA: hydrogenase [Clostridiales bacterium]|nr:MAG: hypothetical protein A2Y22_06890 [Clostridiales bacterium GWD2_32_59]HAN09831.1 hydrogenase [Clostridiales bacterium]
MIINMIFVLFIGMILISSLLKNIKVISIINIVGTMLIGGCFISVVDSVYKYEHISFLNNFLYIDSLNVIQIFIIMSISIISLLYAHKYIAHETKEHIITIGKAKTFYILFDLFVMSMIIVAISNNIVAMWMGLEATTISTAFLIGFSKNKLSIEAAWKYIIICSLGIGIGLIGIILFIYSAGVTEASEIANWTYLVSKAGILDKDIAKIAFVFIFIGIGTKAGIAPMHTWLPISHSEAPSPISALMSGALLNLALYVIVRFYIIIKLVSGLENLKYLFIIFGCISLIVSSFSILRQTNYKRLLAFSSIENIGIMTLGFGFGGYIAIFGSLLHGVIHAFGKALLFLVSGNILSVYKTKRMDVVQNLIKTMPINSVFLILGMLIIVGAPPFASFLSEYKIMIGGIHNDYLIYAIIYAVCLLLVFIGFLKSFIKMIFEQDNSKIYTKSDMDKENILPIVIAFVLVVLTSVFFGGYLTEILDRATLIIES